MMFLVAAITCAAMMIIIEQNEMQNVYKFNGYNKAILYILIFIKLWTVVRKQTQKAESRTNFS